MNEIAIQPFPRVPLVLLAGHSDRPARSLGAALQRGGYAVLFATTGREALGGVPSAEPDVVVADADLPDLDAVEFCRSLRAALPYGPHAPILLVASAPPPRARRLAALEAGAWDIVVPPFDEEELTLRLAACVRLKLAADAAAASSFVDEATGLYNSRGIARRAREIGAFAARHRAPLACLVVGPGADDALAEWGSVVRDHVRTEDVVGRLGERELVVVAPGTGPTGAAELSRRLHELIGRTKRAAGGESVHVGYDAVTNMAYGPVGALELIGRARIARRAADRGGPPIRAYG